MEMNDGEAKELVKKRQIPGSNAFVPSVVGLIIAGRFLSTQ